MGSAGAAASDAAAGAALGSVAGPWGTAAGAVVGGLYGAFGSGGSAPATPNANPGNFQLGQGNGSDYTNQIAGALANRGNAADATAALMQSQAQGAYGVAAGAQGIGAPQIQQNEADRQRQIAALGGTNTSAANLTGAAGQLQQMGTDGLPLGVAAAQLQQGENANMNQALALAHSGRSLGGGAAALQAAQFQNAQTGQVTNQQAAAASLQEQQQNQQYKLAALGASQQGYGSAGSLYGQAGTQAGGINQTDLGVQQTNAQLQQGQQGINNQTSSTFGQMGANLDQSALGQQQLGQNYQGQGIGVLDTQLGANGNYSSQSLGQGNIGTANTIAQNTQNQAQLSAGLQGGAQVLAGVTRASDRNAKLDIQPANMALSLLPPRSSLAAPAARLAAPSLAAPAARLAALGGGNMQLQAPVAIDTNAPDGGLSGVPTRAASPMAGPGMASALRQFSGTGATTSAGPSAPAGLVPGTFDPYLGAIAGTGNRYAPNGYVDPVFARYQAAQSALPTGQSIAPNPKAFDQGGTAVVPVTDEGTSVTGSRAPYQSNALPDSRTRASDVHSKTRIQELESQLAALRPPTVPRAGENTQLTTQQLPGFQRWLAQNHVSDLDNPDSHYDYRGAYAGGVGRGSGTGHFPDTYKQHGHPTFSIESQYSQNANDGGSWEGERFSPPVSPQQPDTGALDVAYRSQGGTPIAPPAVDLRPAQGYSYEYKDPAAHGQGRFYGPMAQDLEQTPAGASTVKQGPDGTKMVDTSRLSLVNTSAISEQQRKLEVLQSQLAALTQPQMDVIQRGFPTSYPTLQQPESPWDRRGPAY